MAKKSSDRTERSDHGSGKAPRWHRRKADRPAEIIAAGLQEFAERGFARTRLEDVAARAGVAKGTIYRYFPGKQALFEAAVRSRLVLVLDDMEQLVDAYPGTSEDLLRTVVTTMYQRLLRSGVPVPMRMVITEGALFPALSEYYHREFVSRGQRLLRGILERGIERGEFRVTPVLEHPTVLIAPTILAALWKMTFERYASLDLETFMDAHLDLMLDGIRAR